MTRQQKIEALAKEHDYILRCQNDNAKYFTAFDSFKAGILAGIRLRDEELLEMEFDAFLAFEKSKEWVNTTTQSAYCAGAREQHEQFIKAIKGDGDE